MEDFEREIRILVVGNGGVGKTSMIKRVCKGTFTTNHKKTTGVDFLEKQLYVPALGQDVHLYLWDTAGQEEFESITKAYYRGAGAAVLVFSTTDRASFDALPAWKAKVQEQCSGIPMVLVQNKVDLLDEAVVSNEKAIAMARQLRLKFYRACVKEDLNITEVFTYLVESHQKKLDDGSLQHIAAVPELEAGSTAAAESDLLLATDSNPALPSSQFGVSAVITTSRSNHGYDIQQLNSSKGAVLGSPASVELQPSIRRGKKKLSSRMKGQMSAAKSTQCSLQ